MVTRQPSCARGAETSKRPTSVSSVFCNSAGLLAGDDVADRPQNNEPDEGNVALPLRCRPAFSLSSSDHERMVDMRDSISKRFGSARGVVRKESKTFVTRRLSTLVSEEERRRRRNASIRCSFMMTARSAVALETRRRLYAACG